MARILFVDDDSEIRQVARKILEREGHTVDLAQEGSQALELIESHKPAVIITDMYMPDVDGMETIIRLAQKYPEMRVVAMSGGGYVGKEEILEIARNLGAHGAIRKPFSPKRLIAEVDEQLRHVWRRVSQSTPRMDDE